MKQYQDDFTELHKYLWAMTSFSTLKLERKFSDILFERLMNMFLFIRNTVVTVVYENIRVIVLQVFVLKGYCVSWFYFLDWHNYPGWWIDSSSGTSETSKTEYYEGSYMGSIQHHCWKCGPDTGNYRCRSTWSTYTCVIIRKCVAKYLVTVFEMKLWAKL